MPTEIDPVMFKQFFQRKTYPVEPLSGSAINADVCGHKTDTGRQSAHASANDGIHDSTHDSATLPRSLSLWQLTLMGVGSTLGTGIFFALAETVPLAGPGVVLSFLLAAFTAGLTALCYAEVSTALPISGSSYTFTYVTMGEGLAVLVGACLILEWGIAGAAVAVGWSSYLNELIALLSGWQIPELWRESPFQTNVQGLHWGGSG
ncbi:MAG: amino acid permease, partial [Orrella sp.]